MTEIRFYLDENLSPVIGEQLVKHGIDAISARDLDTLGDSDFNHLQRATEMGRVLCTHDQDFLAMAAEGMSHAGIAFGEHFGSTFGGWVKALRQHHAIITSEEMIDQVKFLKVK